jgi:hypothetical protein
MLPLIIAAVGGYLIADSQRDRGFSLDKYAVLEKGGNTRIKVGTFDEAQLKKGEDKIATEKAKKESGLTYTDTKIIKKGGKMFLEVYLVPNNEYFWRYGL